MAPMESNIGNDFFDAIFDGNLEVVESMLQTYPDLLTEHMVALHYACGCGRLEIAKLLVERGAIVDHAMPLISLFSYHEDDTALATPLHCASQSGYKEIVSFLIDKGADIEARIKCTCCEETRETPLEVACNRNHVAVAWVLLKAGAIVDESLVQKICDPKSEEQNLEMARWFFKHKTKTLCCAQQVTLLHVACVFGSVMATLRLLQIENIEIDEETCQGKTPLILACEFGHSRIVHLLLNQGVSIAEEDREGWTALHWACGKGYTEIVEMLLDQDAYMEAEERHGWTPLLLAAQNDKLKAVRLLVSRGADIHTGGTCGWPPCTLPVNLDRSKWLDICWTMVPV